MNDSEDYHVPHRPRNDGPPSFNLLQGSMVPDDVYDRPDFYAADPGSMSFRQSIAAVIRVRGKPNALVTVYRSCPRNELNTGDWVSFSKRYAKQHGMADDPRDDVPVWGFKVRAKDVIWPMDDIEEFGYFGPPVKPPTAIQPVLPKPVPPFKEWLASR